MPVDLIAARNFVYQNGALWERLIFGHLFEDRPVEPVQRALLAYKNSDNGFGNGLEHDLKAPDSNTAALEFLLFVLTRTGIDPGGELLRGVTHWVEMHRNQDGSLWSPAGIKGYPLMPWWEEWGGQPAPDSITGNLRALGHSSASLDHSTQRWVQENLTLEAIRAVDWLFMNYHAYDYFFHADDYPDVETHRKAAVENILRCAEAAPPKQRYVFFTFAPTPHSPVALAADESLIERCLDTVEKTQRDDGGWDEEHDLPQWRPWVTIGNLLALRDHGRLEISF